MGAEEQHTTTVTFYYVCAVTFYYVGKYDQTMTNLLILLLRFTMYVLLRFTMFVNMTRPCLIYDHYCSVSLYLHCYVLLYL